MKKKLGRTCPTILSYGCGQHEVRNRERLHEGQGVGREILKKKDKIYYIYYYIYYYLLYFTQSWAMGADNMKSEIAKDSTKGRAWGERSWKKYTKFDKIDKKYTKFYSVSEIIII